MPIDLLAPLNFLQPVEVIPTSTIIDMFGRVKTSESWNVAQIKQDSTINRALTLTHGAVTANAGLSATEENSSLLISTTNTAGYYRARSRHTGIYQNGKSITVFFSFNFGSTGTTGVDKRCGYFSGTGATRDGIFLRQNGTTVSWNLSNALNSTNIEVTQASWINNLTLDWTTAQIGFISFEYLGVGDVVCGFVQDRQVQVAAIFSHKNNLNIPYMSSPNQFLNYEMEISRATTNLETFRVICATCLIEGTIEQDGYLNCFNTTTSLSIGQTAVAIAVFRSTSLNSRIEYDSAEMNVSNQAAVLVRMVRLTGTPTNLPDSTIQNGIEVWFPTENTVGNLDGVTMAQTLFTQSQRLGKVTSDITQLLESNFDDTAVYYAVIAISSVNGTPNVYRTLNFINQV